jgi:transposase
MTHTISEADIQKLDKQRKENNDKRAEKRMYAVKLRGQGKSNKAIAEILETSSDVVSYWISLYVKGGIEALLPRPRPGRPTQMSFEEEAELLAGFEAKAAAGQVVEVSDIKAAYQEKVGHRIGTAQIYYVLKRHDWRKVKPRSRHPKKASPEAIEASKKLTPESMS